MNVDSCILYQKDGKYLLIDSNTSKLFSIKKDIFDIISKLKQNKRFDEIIDPLDEKYRRYIIRNLEMLKRKGIIGRPRRNFIKEGKSFTSRLHLAKSSVSEGNFFIAQNCNLDCRYCYGGDSGTFGRKPGIMSKEVAEEGIKYLVDNHGVFSVQKVALFGGEPLLNFPVVVHLLEYWEKLKPSYKDLKLYFTMTTNGTLFTPEILDFIKKKHIVITVSLDGPAEIHNKNRMFKKNRKGSFDAVMAGIESLRQRNIRFGIRCTVTSQADIKKIRAFFNKNNFDIVLVDLVDNPTIDKNKDYQFDLNEYRKITKEQLSIYMDSLTDIQNKNSKSFEAKQVSQMYMELTPQKDYWPLKCGAGWSMLAFDIEGDIYPCQRSVGHKEFYLGNVFNGRDKHKLQRLYLNFIEANKACNDCWYMDRCKGHCMLNKSNGDGYFHTYDKRICDVYREAAMEQGMCTANLINLSKKNKDTVLDVVTRYNDKRIEQEHFDHYAALEKKNV